MRRRRLSALALVVALLVATAPAAAATTTAVASSHTTAADFNAGSLSGQVAVEGSGSSASVVIQTETTDTFTTPGSKRTWSVPPGVDEITLTVSGAGGGSVDDTGAVFYYDGGDGGLIEDASVDVSTFSQLEIWVGEGGYGGETGGQQAGGWGRSNGGDGVDFGIGGGGSTEIWADDESTFIAAADAGAGAGSEGSMGNANGGGGGGARGGAGGDDDGSEGGAQGTGNGGDGVYGGAGGDGGQELGAATGGTTTTGGGGAGGEGNVDGRGENGSVSISYDTSASGTYISATHSVDAVDVQQGFTDLSLSNAEAVVTWQENTGSGWADIRQDTYTTSGNKSVDISSASNDDLRVNVTFDASAGGATAELHDDGVTKTYLSPTLDNSSASPEGSLTTADATLSIDVNDSDFPDPQGDSVEAEFYVDGGTAEGTDTLTANGTASLPVDLDGGSHTWHVELEDSVGLTQSSQDFSVSVPDVLQVRNASDEGQLLDDRTVEGDFYAVDGIPIAFRSANDGNLSMTDLSVGEPFVVVVDAPGYHQRPFFLNDLFSQADVFLLNESADTVTVTFDIVDNSGNFPLGDSYIQIQRALNRSEFTPNEEDRRWTTISGEKLGVDGEHSTTLEQFERYRVVVQNAEGDQQVLGEFIPEESGTRTYQIGERVFDFTDQESSVEYGAEYDASGGTTYVRFSLNDSEQETENVDVVIHERGNASNEIYNATSPGPYGSLSISHPLTASQESTEWVVDWEAENPNGKDGVIGDARIVGQQNRPLDIGGPDVETAASVLVLLLTFFMTSAGLNRYAGAVLTPAMAGVLFYVGFMPAGVGVGVIIFALFLGASFYASSARQGVGF